MLKYQKVGDIVLVKRDLSQEEIEYIVNKTRCKTIVKYRGIVGDRRKPEVEVIYGSETETIHREYNCLFKLDVRKVMWSMGNIEERKRMAHISSPGEVVVDMFAGIGYFSIPMAKYSRPRRIYGVEINPEAYNYLEENIRLNKLENVVPILGDNRELDLENIAHRVVMGYVLKTRFFLDKAFQLLKEEGGVIHYHDTLPEKAFYSEGVYNIMKTAKDHNYKLTSYGIRRIKKYAPGVWHVVIDAKVKRR
ncbi:MAG TPA: class I SAM-dependent methyltransferase family protein [Methanothermococcus okinawensis]|uniref:tRNA(Phe) (4-demethylwyosine(37)-C(7)) aminocarboxypropyltransferase n=1 Tax=Methanothermococcus okinawensis TaxID=155863 RepID=A0A832ZIM4_9EURY|nr:class I SAM-dependent methyltransferase family protein [Methanothermococcus okinawensis]